MKLKLFALSLLIITAFSIAFPCFASNSNQISEQAESNSREGISIIESGEKAQYGITTAILGISYNPSTNSVSFSYNTKATHVSSQVGMSYIALEKWESHRRLLYSL